MSLRSWFSFRRPSSPAAIADDVSAYVELLVEEKMRAGMTHVDARRAALAEAGSLRAAREAVHDESRSAPIRTLIQDLRHALRLMRRSPGFTAAVLTASALGIGSTAATFSAVDAVLMRPLPYANADRLVVLLHHGTDPVAPANFLDWRRSASSFDAMGAADYWSPNLRGDGAPEKVLALHVTSDLLPMLGVAPELGRLPAADARGAGEIVISDGLWRRRFSADPGIVGRPIRVDDADLTVVGVMPASFHFAPFWATQAELWGGFDLSGRTDDRNGESLRIFARLSPGVSLAHAQAELDGITAAIESRYPSVTGDVRVTSLKDQVVGNVRTSMLVLFGAVGCVLVIACANVAHLLLARSATRQREFAVRCAIGASRARVVRQLLTESVVLALTGGAAGIALAYGGVRVFTALGATTVPRLQTMALDGRVVTFATVLSVVTGLLFGLVPARAMSRVDVTDGLRREERGSTSGRASRGTRLWLIGSQVALALVLLTGAGLLLRSLLALRAIDLGFATDRVASFVVSVAGTAEWAPGRRGAFYDEVLDRLRATPGVASAAAINHVPLVGDMWRLPYEVEGHTTGATGKRPSATYRVASAGYFETMRMRMAEGRTFTSADRDSSEPVVIVNARLAADAWPGQSAIGKHLRVPFGPPQDQAWRTVVGVSENTVRGDIRDTPAAEFFLPLAQNASYRTAPDSHIAAMTFVVRAAGDPAALVPSMRSVVRAIAADVPVSEVFVMRDVVDRAGDGSRFLAVLLGVFAGVAGALAVLGVFGIISHDVAARQREIGIRLALGATPSRVAAGIARDGLVAACAGLGVGLGAAAALRGALSTLLVGVTPFDPATIAVVTAGLAAVSAIACGAPAYRAARSWVAETLR